MSIIPELLMGKIQYEGTSREPMSAQQAHANVMLNVL